MRIVQYVSVTAYFALIGYKHSRELSRLVLNTCILMGLFTVEFASRKLQVSSAQFMCREEGYRQLAVK